MNEVGGSKPIPFLGVNTISYVEVHPGPAHWHDWDMLVSSPPKWPRSVCLLCAVFLPRYLEHIKNIWLSE